MKSNLILAAIALVLAVPTALEIVSDKTLFTEYASVPRMFAGFDPERVNVILMGKPKEGQEPPVVDPNDPDKQQPQIERDLIAFQRKEDGWVLAQHELAGAPVQGNRVESDILDHLGDIRVDQGTVIVQNADEETMREFGLADDQAFIIKCVDAANQTIAELLVGNDARGGRYTQEAVTGFFVRKSGTRDVVLYEVPYWRHSVKAEEWIDKKVHQLKAEEIAKFSFKNEQTGGQELIFEKVEGSDASWKVVQGPEGVGALRQQELENMVQRFLWVNAMDLVKPLNQAKPAELGLQPPRVLVSATLKDGSVYSIAVGSKVPDKAEYYLSSNQGDFLYTLAEYAATPFERDPKELFDPSPDAVQDGDKPGEDEQGEAKSGEDKTGEEKTGADKPGDGEPDASKDAGAGGTGPTKSGEPGTGDPKTPPQSAEPKTGEPKSGEQQTGKTSSGKKSGL